MESPSWIQACLDNGAVSIQTGIEQFETPIYRTQLLDRANYLPVSIATTSSNTTLQALVFVNPIIPTCSQELHNDNTFHYTIVSCQMSVTWLTESSADQNMENGERPSGYLEPINEHCEASHASTLRLELCQNKSPGENVLWIFHIKSHGTQAMYKQKIDQEKYIYLSSHKNAIMVLYFCRRVKEVIKLINQSQSIKPPNHVTTLETFFFKQHLATNWATLKMYLELLAIFEQWLKC